MFIFSVDPVSKKKVNATNSPNNNSVNNQITKLDSTLLRKKGDVNGDGFIDRDDRERLQQGIIAGNLTPDEMWAGDLNGPDLDKDGVGDGDGKVDFEGDVIPMFKLVFDKSIGSIKEHTTKVGDLDGDGDVDQRDYWALDDARLAFRRGLLTSGQISVADVNHDGVVNRSDLTFMENDILHLPQNLGIPDLSFITSRIREIALRGNNNSTKLEQLKTDLFNGLEGITGLSQIDVAKEGVLKAITERKDINGDGSVDALDILEEWTNPFLSDVKHLTLTIRKHAENGLVDEKEIHELGVLLEKNTGLIFTHDREEALVKLFKAIKKGDKELIALLDVNNDKIINYKDIRRIFKAGELPEGFRILNAVKVLTGKLIEDAKDGKLSNEADKLLDELSKLLARWTGKPPTKARLKALKDFFLQVAMAKGKGPDVNGDKVLDDKDAIAIWGKI